MSAPRVLLTIRNLDTAGMKYVLADVARYLVSQGWHPCIAVRRWTHTELERQLQATCSVIQLDVQTGTRNPFTLARRLPHAVGTLRRYADLVHSFDYSSESWEGLFVRAARIPWIAAKTNLEWEEQRWRLRCQLAHQIVCLSQAQAALLKSWQQKVVVIPTGVDTKRFSQARALPRAELGLNDADLVLVCVAHLVPVKGHPELLQAFSIVSRETPTLRLVLAGEGEEEYTRQLRRQAEELGIAGKVVFLGRTARVPELLRACDGKILATRNTGRREGFGAAVVEAMAAGLPVIATRSGGPEEIVAIGETGWLVSGEGVEPLAEAMREFCRNPERRVQFGAAASLRARTLFERDTMARRYMELYEAVH